MWQSKSFLYRLQSKAKSSSGLYKIGQRDIKKEWIVLPRADEQKSIVGLLDAAEAHIEASKNSIESLAKLKKSLLQNLLTGKIRLKTEALK